MEVRTSKDGEKFEPVSITFTCNSPVELQFIKDMFNPDIEYSKIDTPEEMIMSETFTKIFDKIKYL